MTQLPETLQAARLKLLWDRPYLGAAVWSVVPVEVKGLGTLAVDKWARLYYDPEALARWNPEERTAVLYHEINHLLRLHAERLDPVTDAKLIANIAADCEINDDLKEEGMKLPAGCVYPSTFGMEDHKTAEEYLPILLKKFPPQPGGSGSGQGPEGSPPGKGKGQGSGPPGTNPCGSGATGKQEPWESPAPGTTPNTPPGMGPAEQGVVRKAVAEAVRAEASKGIGNIPGYLKRWAEEILTPKVDWRAALRGAVRGAIGRAAGTEDYSFHRPARRSAAVRVILPSLVKPVPRVALTIDTSGSMGSKQLEQAIGEVKGVLRTVGQPIEVMSVDMEVHTKQRVGRASQVKLEGGGGTDMGVGLVAACALKPKPDVVVVLTDGQTGWPETQPNGIRVVIALLCDKGNVPQTPDWARTVVAEVAGA
jgi:predicted metal-dependent peptidase